MAIANTKSIENVDQLNSFLRGERSAAEAYRIAIERLDAGSPHHAILELCFESHQARAEKLASRVRQYGGEPSNSGVWGTFTGAVETTAATISDSASISALESGEDHGLADYKRDVGALSPELRGLVNSELLPAQEETHRKMATLKKQLAR